MEEHFYLFWPLVLVAVVRWPRPRRWLLLGAVLALTIGLRALFWSQTRHPFICTNTLTRLDPLVVGIVLAVWRKGRAPSQGAIGPLLEFLGGCVVVSLVALAPSIRLQTSNVVWQYLATAVGYGLMLDGAIASRRGPLTWALSLKPFVFLGRLTYGLYIYHILGLQFGHLCFVHLGRLLQVRSSPVAWAIQTTLALALTVAAATVSYYTFEAFFLSLKTKFTHIASRPNPWKSPESPAAAPDRAPESACSPTSSQTAS
jgi:peptidoglycan/LPS O-acetylase OafA/YrhL